MDYTNLTNQRLVVGSIKSLEGGVKIPVGSNVGNIPNGYWWSGVSFKSLTLELESKRRAEAQEDKILFTEWQRVFNREKRLNVQRLYYFNKYKKKFFVTSGSFLGNKYTSNQLEILLLKYTSVYDLLGRINSIFEQNIQNDGYVCNIAELTQTATIGQRVYNSTNGGIIEIILENGIDYTTLFAGTSYQDPLMGSGYYYRGSSLDNLILNCLFLSKLYHINNPQHPEWTAEYHLAFTTTDSDEEMPLFSTAQKSYDSLSSNKWKLSLDDLGKTKGKAIWAIPFYNAMAYGNQGFDLYDATIELKDDGNEYCGNAILIKSCAK